VFRDLRLNSRNTLCVSARAVAVAACSAFRGNTRGFQTRSLSLPGGRPNLNKKKAMHSFFKRKDPPGEGVGGVSTSASASKAARTASSNASGGGVQWSSLHGSFMARVDGGGSGSDKIAAFDLDDTLQKTKSGKPGYVVTDINDFIWWHSSVPRKIKQLADDGFKIVIFSNQGGVKGALDGVRAKVVRKRVDTLCAKFPDVPICFFCGTQSGPAKDPHGYRKPATGAWVYFTNNCNGDGSEVDFSKSFYVGDAAGRAAEAGRAEDHSVSDLQFAQNVGIAFFTPEQFFLEGTADTLTTSAKNDAENDSKEKEKDIEDNTQVISGQVIVLGDDADDDDDVPFNRDDTP
jgi:bifunctional polynucleotide phosphatase/kinase